MSAATPVTNPQAHPTTTNSSLLNAYLNNMAMINAPVVKVQKPETTTPANYHNDLRSLFRNNEAKIPMIVPRTFNAQDKNGNEYIDGNEIHGTF